MTILAQNNPITPSLQSNLTENISSKSTDAQPQPCNWLDNIHIISGESLKPLEIARELDVDFGSIITPIICRIGENDLVTVLMASDMACDPVQVSKALRRPHDPIERLSQAEIAVNTTMTRDTMFPLQLAFTMPVIIDASLKRFENIYSQAGNRKCMIVTTYIEVKDLTQGTVSYAMTSSNWSVAPKRP